MSRLVETPERKSNSAKWPMIITGAVMAAGAINAYASERVYGWNKDTQLITLPYVGPQIAAAGIAFPGMGNIGNGGEQMAQQMSDAIPIQQPWSYISYDNLHKLTIPPIGKCLKEYKEEYNLKFLDMHLSSMGFKIGLASAKEAKIPLRVIFINSAPYTVDQGYGSKLGKFAAKLPNTGIAGKAIGTYVADSIRPGKYEGSKIRHAINESLRGGSQVLFRSQVELDQEIDLDKDWKQYRGVISPDFTRVIYASPPAGSDNTVRVGEAYISVREFFNRLGVKVERVIMQEGDHADTEKAIKYGKKALYSAYKETQHLLAA